MKLGVALSGGGIRGIAHAGVLKALDDNDIKIDIIGGCSSGSIVAALYAMGYKPDYIFMLSKKYAKEISKFDLKTFVEGIKDYIFKDKKITGLRDAIEIEKICNRLASKKKIIKIRDIPMPLVIPSVDITESKEYVFTNKVPKNADDKLQYITDISVGKAIRASSSFPVVFSPCKMGKHIFLDGGLLDNVPVNEVKKHGADRVLAVKFDAEKINKNSNVMDIIMKTIDIMGNKISEESIEMSDFVLNVFTDKVGLLDADKLYSCYKYGYNAVIGNLDKIKKLTQNTNK